MMGLRICGTFLLQAQVKSTEFLTSFKGIFPQNDSILLYIYISILWCLFVLLILSLHLGVLFLCIRTSDQECTSDGVALFPTNCFSSSYIASSSFELRSDISLVAFDLCFV